METSSPPWEEIRVLGVMPTGGMVPFGDDLGMDDDVPQLIGGMQVPRLAGLLSQMRW